MKLSGKTALYAQLKQHQDAVNLTQRLIALVEEFEKDGEEKAPKKIRRKRTPKVPEGVIGKPNGFDEAEA